jgi:hypothetical protein
VNDREFLDAFEAAAIPRADWKHRDHIRVAYLYLRDHPFDDALVRIRTGIRKLNDANGVPESPTSGYHETVTVAWALLVVDAIERSRAKQQSRAGEGAADSESFMAAHPELLDKTALRAHYSRDRIMSVEARAAFVAPDHAPLPAPNAPGLD